MEDLKKVSDGAGVEAALLNQGGALTYLVLLERAATAIGIAAIIRLVSLIATVARLQMTHQGAFKNIVIFLEP